MARTIIHTEIGGAKWGDKDHLEVVKQKSFTELIFELLSEREPSKEELKVFELILNLSIDHGPDTPSAVEVIKAAKEGKSMSESLAAGILRIGDVHGGAAEPLMKWLYEIENGEHRNMGIPEMVNYFTQSGGKVPGFGHRIYKDKDPRAELIMDSLAKLSTEENKYVLILQLTRAYMVDRLGKSLPVNIDGAIAAALCTMGFKPEIGKAVFIIARTPGLIGQYLNTPENLEES